MPAKLLLKALDPLSAGLVSGEPFFVPATVQNTGHEGLGEVELRLGNEVIQRSAGVPPARPSNSLRRYR